MEGSSGKNQYGRVQSVIISSLSREKALETARRLAAEILCTSEGERPCGRCASCGKIERNTHPDVFFISRLTDAKGNPKRDIAVDQIREISADAYILPNEADRKVYIILEAEKMNTSAQNAALKLLEEPPNGAVLLLCTDNPAALLPTVRSRCTEISVNVERDEGGEAAGELAGQYLRLLAAGDRAELAAFCFRNENMPADSFLVFLNCAREQITDMLCGRRDNGGLGREMLLRTAELVEKCIRYRQANVSVKLLFGMLAAGSPKREKAKKNEV